VVVNLVINGLQACERGGKVTVATSADGEFVVLTVADTGSGMSAEAQKNLFMPFYTTKEVGQGTGLGLSVVHGIVTAHGGSIDVQSAPNEGTRFEVRFRA
jgi:signal transduction histidine kinase